MARVDNVQKVIAAMRKRASEILGRSMERASAGGSGRVSVAIGYTTHYAIYVHENLQARHTVGQAKYLEQPFRELSHDLARQITRDVRGGMGLPMAMLRAGLRVQRESQLLVPIDTGILRSSAFTELEEGASGGMSEDKERGAGS